MALMATPAKFTGPVNLGNPNEFSMLELAQKVIALTGSRSKIEMKPLPSDDPTQRQPDIALARKYLDWEPKVQLDHLRLRCAASKRDWKGPSATSSRFSAMMLRGA